MSKAIFLPGAGGSRLFWLPVVNQISMSIDPVMPVWPGFARGQPRDDSISSLTDLVDYLLRRFIHEPADLVAQSMGGVVAMMLALRRPELVRRLVLTGTSGGIDINRFGGEDWRAEWLTETREATPRWFVDDRTDLTEQIPSITAPTLLIWGEDDRISPPAVGEYLATLLPNAEFVLVPGGHAHPNENPELAAALLDRFLLEDAEAGKPRLREEQGGSTNGAAR